ncbi:uncharacterized protein TEOVI_000770500 [Trypanosoma equiperdum]|uniref:Uncharacterized protein n=2 Tax=Trypanozoon TaxID=39700 RepID=Q57ZM6_TRYB2|nr:hypothetical protein, conserved [Trypanosoma brucei brucei TREU927]AAX79457.1 hypothetical protein, conserved [Trypanosoma brucei]AAZ10320.1 hypothetical protein, conserved [Trypanosoma brucei brucei TREU927]SCU67362.1 hypothetical protein, conserved [Trypanosoma equiperdum]
MFRGVLATTGRQRRVERRLATVVNSTGRRATKQWTHRVCMNEFLKQQAATTRREEKWKRRHGSSALGIQSPLTAADVKALHQQQSEALANETAYGRTVPSTSNEWNERSHLSRAQHCGYDTVDAHSGQSIAQQRFDSLARDAVLKYGPPLPVEFVAENDVITIQNTVSRSGVGDSSSLRDSERDANHFYDEVQVRPQELFQMIRKLDSSFSVHTHADGVPFSLLIKNCSYFNVRGGRVHFMRCLRRVKLSQNTRGDVNTEGSDEPAEVIVVLSRYKMREAPSFDGVRQGPQPWLYSYKMV